MKAKDLIRIIKKDGWRRVKSKGHLQFEHPTKEGRVTISFHGNHDLVKKTVKSILKQAQINLEQL